MKGYRFAVNWIAENDEPSDRDPEVISGYISTLLVADIFEKHPLVVAEAISRQRAKLGIETHLW